MGNLTLVMPVWNASFVLSQTIDSIFNQTCDDFKVIIVNDGSSDGTKDILEEIHDERFTIIHLQERQGAGNARNVANNKAHTDLISVIDCGDVLYSNKVADTISYFNNNSNIDIMCSATDSLDGTPAIPPRLFKGRKGEKLGFEHPGVTYRKQVTDKIKYRTTSIHTDQYDAFFFECVRAGFSFGIHDQALSSKCTFGKYEAGRDLDKALLVKACIYREFNVPLPEWLIEHETKMKEKTND